MIKIKKPFILVIDDESDNLGSQIHLGLADRATASVIHPRDIEMSDLESADLVLVDYRLDSWSERDEQPVSLRPATGMALAVVLREQLDRSQEGKLTAFALHTAHLGDIRGRLPAVTAQHVVARMNNLEWVFSKTDSKRFDQMVSLAQAIRQMRDCPPDSNDETSSAKRLLGMDDLGRSSERCWQDVLDCRVPIHQLATRDYRIPVIRWLLHQVLPYPSFLWAEHWVAGRLRISVDALREVLAGNGDLARDLESMRYSGVLAGFLRDRWWRGALEDYVWDLAGRHRAEEQRLREALNERAAMNLDPIDANPAVVCVDKGLQPTGQFLSPTTAVTLRPDHWPPFADSAWMDAETVRDDAELLSMVNPVDRHRVVSADE